MAKKRYDFKLAKASLTEKGINTYSAFYRFSPSKKTSSKEGGKFITETSNDGAVYVHSNVNFIDAMVKNALKKIEDTGNELSTITLGTVIGRRDDLVFFNGPKGDDWINSRESYALKKVLSENDLSLNVTEKDIKKAVNKALKDEFEEEFEDEYDDFEDFLEDYDSDDMLKQRAKARKKLVRKTIKKLEEVLTKDEIEFLSDEFNFRATMSKAQVKALQKAVERYKKAGAKTMIFVGLYDFGGNKYNPDKAGEKYAYRIGDSVYLQHVQYVPIIVEEVNGKRYVEEHAVSLSFENPNKGKSKKDDFKDANAGWVLKTGNSQVLKNNVMTHESDEDGSKFYTTSDRIAAKLSYDKELEENVDAKPFDTMLITPIKYNRDGKINYFNGTLHREGGGERFLSNTFDFTENINLNISIGAERKGQPYGITGLNKSSFDDVAIIFGKYDIESSEKQKEQYLETIEDEEYAERFAETQLLQLKLTEISNLPVERVSDLKSKAKSEDVEDAEDTEDTEDTKPKKKTKKKEEVKKSTKEDKPKKKTKKENVDEDTETEETEEKPKKKATKEDKPKKTKETKKKEVEEVEEVETYEDDDFDEDEMFS